MTTTQERPDTAAGDYSLAQLRGFVAVAEESNFGRAAERLHMTQPPLTRQIQGLERALGVRLFDRGGRGATLTPAGHAFLHDTRRILALVDAAPSAARRVAAGEQGTLRLGFTAISAYAILPQVLDAVSLAVPGVDVALTEQVSEPQLEALRTGLLDLAIVRPPVPDAFASMLVHTEDLVLALPCDHPLADAGRPLRISEVADDYVGYSPEGSPYLHDVCAALVGVRGFLRTRIVSQVPTMLALVAARLAFALVPRSCQQLRVADVAFRDLDRADSHRVSLYAAWDPASVNPVVPRIVPALRSALSFAG